MFAVYFSKIRQISANVHNITAIRYVNPFKDKILLSILKKKKTPHQYANSFMNKKWYHSLYFLYIEENIDYLLIWVYKIWDEEIYFYNKDIISSYIIPFFFFF